MKKFIKNLIFIIVLSVMVIYTVNSETDFFKNFKENNPEISQKAPFVADIMNNISIEFSKLPTISQVIENIKNQQMPVDPESFAENASIKDSPLLTFFEKETVGITINNDSSFTVFGIMSELARPNIIIRLTGEDEKVIGETTFATDTAFEFSKTIEIPDTNHNKIFVDIYTGAKKYGNYNGWANRYISLVREDNVWNLEKSPVLQNNYNKYDTQRSTAKALKSTKYIQSDNPSIKSVAEQLTKDCTTDYEKIKALHDWICNYLHYDNDSLSKSNVAPYSATEVLRTRKAVCIGYANLYSALCRSINIPCYVVTGYALGISSGALDWTSQIIKGNEENHAWNEAYVDGRWIIIDTTWDSFNSYENGEMKKGSQISYLYFDSNIDFFSLNHKIISYE